MRKLGVFDLVTLDGYFTGEGGSSADAANR